MKRIFSVGAVTLLAVQAFAEPEPEAPLDEASRAEKIAEPKPLVPLDDGGGAGKKILIVPIEGPIDLGLVPFLDRALSENADADALLLKVNTFGGRVDAAVKIRDTLLTLDIPTVAFVHRRAISAGALISLATDQMIFSSGGSMGAATPIQINEGKAEAVGEKIMSYMRAEMRATAEAKGRQPEIAEAMVDKEIEVEGISKKGVLLTLSTEQALEVGWANAKAETLDEALGALGLEEAERVEPEVNWAEAFVRFLTRPEVSGALMSLGLLALAVELYSPGLGLAGGVGIIFLGLFFGGHMAVHLAGWEEVIICVVGVLLLLAEIFLTPGFGVLGVVGLGLVGTSLVLALLGMPFDVSWETGRLGEAIRSVLLSFGLSIFLLVVLARFLPSRFANALVLRTAVGDMAQDSTAFAERTERQSRVGETGVALTDLRPSGKARFGEDILDVSSRHEYIDEGEAVRVVTASGMTVVVEKLPS